MTIERVVLGTLAVFGLIFIVTIIFSMISENRSGRVTFRRPAPKTRPPTSRPKGPAPEPPWMPENPVFEGQSMLVDPECVYCGRNNRPGARECKGCGASMGGKVRTPKPPAPPPQDVTTG